MTTRDQLKKLMDEHDLTIAQVAVILGISASTVNGWYYGARNMPSLKLELLQLKLAADTGDK